jgi:hypothetical protein
MERYAYYESPLYIIHENEVIYQDAAGRKIIHPDLSTFRLLDLNEEIGIAVDKNGIYFKGVFLAVDTCGIDILHSSSTPFGARTEGFGVRSEGFATVL